MSRPATYEGQIGFPARTPSGEAIRLDPNGEFDKTTALVIYKEYGGSRLFVPTGTMGVMVDLTDVYTAAQSTYDSVYALAMNWPIDD